MTSTNELEEFIKWSYPRDIVEVDDEEFLNEVSLEMECLLDKCKIISKESISNYLEKITNLTPLQKNNKSDGTV